MGFEYSGFDKLERNLQSLKVKLNGPAQERMVRAGAKVFKRGMVARAPVLKPGTGGTSSLPPEAMKNGIGITVRKKGTTEAVAHIGPRGRDLKLKAWDVEYGHQEINHGVQGEDVPAHPFIRPTFEADKAEAEEAMIGEVNKTFQESQDA